MQPNNPIFDDLARVAGGALSAVGGIREEIEAKLKDKPMSDLLKKSHPAPVDFRIAKLLPIRQKV